MQDLDLLEWDPEVFGAASLSGEIFGDPQNFWASSPTREWWVGELLAYLLLLLELLFMVMLP